ncbi:MAG: restriction endonuclease subunit S, partial [Campylobacter sp.]|nr:restriction endonuclease subunit S [Campylobacter sp.]
MIKLNDIAEIKTGLVLSRKKAEAHTPSEYSYKIVSLKSFAENAIYDNSFADEFISNEQINDDYKVSLGDVLLRLREPNFAVYIDKDYDDLIYSSLMVRIRVKSDKFDPHFVAHYLNSSAVKRTLAPDVSGTTIA